MADHSSSSGGVVMRLTVSRSGCPGGPGSRPRLPGPRLVAGFGDAKPSSFGRFLGEGEFDELRVAVHGFGAAGMVPAEREAGRRVDGLDDDRAALVAEFH